MPTRTTPSRVGALPGEYPPVASPACARLAPICVRALELVIEVAHSAEPTAELRHVRPETE